MASRHPPTAKILLAEYDALRAESARLKASIDPQMLDAGVILRLRTALAACVEAMQNDEPCTCDDPMSHCGWHEPIVRAEEILRG